MLTRKRREALLVIVAGLILGIFATATGLVASPVTAISGGAEAVAGEQAANSSSRVNRLSPQTRPLTQDEATAFRNVFPDVASDGVPVAHGRTEFDGDVWSITTWRNAAHQFCFGTNVPGEGHSQECMAADDLFAERPIRIGRGAQQEGSGWKVVWVEGVVAPSVRSVLMMTAECEKVPIHVDGDGVFFHLISGAAAVGGQWPVRVDAIDGTGAVVTSTRLPITEPDAESPFASDQPTCS